MRVRGARGSGRPSGSRKRRPSSSSGWPWRSIGRPRSSTGLPSRARSGKPWRSTRGMPVGCGQRGGRVGVAAEVVGVARPRRQQARGTAARGASSQPPARARKPRREVSPASASLRRRLLSQARTLPLARFAGRTSASSWRALLNVPCARTVPSRRARARRGCRGSRARARRRRHSRSSKTLDGEQRVALRAVDGRRRSARHIGQPSELKTASAKRADGCGAKRSISSGARAARRPLALDLERQLRREREPQLADLAREREHGDRERGDRREREPEADREPRLGARIRCRGRAAAARRRPRAAACARARAALDARARAEAPARLAGAAVAKRAREQPGEAELEGRRGVGGM